MNDDKTTGEGESASKPTVTVSAATFARLSAGGRHDVTLPFVDYSTAVARLPDAKSADTVGFVPSLWPTDAVVVATGAGKSRQEIPATVAAVRKVLRGGKYATRSRMGRLALRVTLDVGTAP